MRRAAFRASAIAAVSSSSSASESSEASSSSLMAPSSGTREGADEARLAALLASSAASCASHSASPAATEPAGGGPEGEPASWDGVPGPLGQGGRPPRAGRRRVRPRLWRLRRRGVRLPAAERAQHRGQVRARPVASRFIHQCGSAAAAMR